MEKPPEAPAAQSPDRPLPQISTDRPHLQQIRSCLRDKGKGDRSALPHSSISPPGLRGSSPAPAPVLSSSGPSRGGTRKKRHSLGAVPAFHPSPVSLFHTSVLLSPSALLNITPNSRHSSPDSSSGPRPKHRLSQPRCVASRKLTPSTLSLTLRPSIGAALTAVPFPRHDAQRSQPVAHGRQVTA